MRIPKEWVTVISKSIVGELLENESIELKETKEKVIEVLEELVLEELMVEDRLNEEVDRILRKYDSEIEKGRLDYRKLFEMTKYKLVRERNIIL